MSQLVVETETHHLHKPACVGVETRQRCPACGHDETRLVPMGVYVAELVGTIPTCPECEWETETWAKEVRLCGKRSAL